MKSLSLKLPRGLDSKLTAAARRNRTSKSAVVRDALEAYFANGRKPLPGSFAEAAKDLIGCVDFGPGDLSYNKKHMKGFGR